MIYSVKFKKPGQWFYRTLKRVKGDGVVEVSGARFFILDDESRIELPASCEFIFSDKRFMLIKETMEKQAGQVIPISK